MGYYSTFKVVDTDIPAIQDVLNDKSDYYDWHTYPWSTWGSEVSMGESTKWYNWIEDLAKLAADYPDNYLVIERHGEESPDISRAIVKFGSVKEVQPTLVWPDY